MVDDSYGTESEEENYNCAFCQKMFCEKTDLMKHVEVSEEEGNAHENFSCPFFQELFSTSGDVMKHMEEH